MYNEIIALTRSMAEPGEALHFETAVEIKYSPNHFPVYLWGVRVTETHRIEVMANDLAWYPVELYESRVVEAIHARLLAMPESLNIHPVTA